MQEGTTKTNRIIGIRHRVKQTRTNEARPTQVAILQDGNVITLDLATEQDELDFINGQYPLKYRPVTADDDLSKFPRHHLMVRKFGVQDDRETIPANLLVYDRGEKNPATHVATKIPISYAGLQARDTVAMALGGSGDLLAYALSVRGKQIGATVLRVPPFKLKQFRGEQSKDLDAITLANYALSQREDFYVISPRDEKVIQIREAFRQRQETQKARIGCEQRYGQWYIGRAMLGMYPQGEIEKEYAAQKANDRVLQALIDEEIKRNDELTKAVTNLDVFCQVFAPVEGMGPALGARIISAVGDIRQFWVLPDPVEMERLYDESRLIEAQYLEPIVGKISSQFTPDMTIWHKLAVAKRHYVTVGNRQATTAIQQAMDIHKQRAKLKYNAEKRGVNKLRAFCGVHVLPNGTFPRSRIGASCNWNRDARQGLYLLGDQFNKRADSHWGKRLRKVKANYRLKHPAPVVTHDELTGLMRQIDRYFAALNCRLQPTNFDLKTVDGLYEWALACQTHAQETLAVAELDTGFSSLISQIEELSVKGLKGGKTVQTFTAGHLHKMAIWWTIGEFAEYIYKEWSKLYS